MFELEERIAASLFISISQLRYAVCLFASIPVGWIQLQLRNVYVAHLFAIVSGFMLIYYPFGSSVWHLIPPAVFTFASLKFAPKRCGMLVWIVCFPHLIYTHFVNASGGAWQQGSMDATGALMILFIQSVAITQCRQDAEDGDMSLAKGYRKEKMIHQSPSLLEFLSYIFGTGRLLSGPFSEFADYKNYIEGKGIWEGQLPPRMIPFFRSLFSALACLAVYVSAGLFFPDMDFSSDVFVHGSLRQRYLTSWITGIISRTKYYFAWCMPETASIASGFGLSSLPTEDGKKKALWYSKPLIQSRMLSSRDRCKNVNIIETEFASSFAKVPANWNICTGIFLRRYVYDRLTPNGQKANFFTLLATQLVSSLWHGLYPGYIIFFVSSAIAIESSKVLHKWEQRIGLSKSLVWKLLKIVWTIIALNNMASSFQILTFERSLFILSSMKFIPHIICVSTLLIGTFLNKEVKQKNKQHSS